MFWIGGGAMTKKRGAWTAMTGSWTAVCSTAMSARSGVGFPAWS